MRIVQIETFGRGGLAHYVDNLSRALAERGHDVAIVTAADYELAQSTDEAQQPKKHRVVKTISRRVPSLERFLPRFLRQPARQVEALLDSFRVASKVARTRPDVVHLHCTNQVAFAYLWWLRVFRQRVVYTAHVVTPHEPIRFQSAIYGRIHRWCKLIVAHSKFDRDRLRSEFGVEDKRLTVIPHGEYSFFEKHGEPPNRNLKRQELGIQEDAEVALFFGYVREYKGLDLLLEAWPETQSQRPNAQLLIAGDPVRLPERRRAELEDWAERLGAVHRFDYIPFEDVAGYFAAADVLVMPYRAISQSGVLFLALSLGLPVVATRVGALPEMLTDGESALLVDPGSPTQLSEALVRVLGSEELRTTLSQGSLRVADDHSWQSIAERTEDAFQQLLQ